MANGSVVSRGGWGPERERNEAGSKRQRKEPRSEKAPTLGRLPCLATLPMFTAWSLAPLLSGLASHC